MGGLRPELEQEQPTRKCFSALRGAHVERLQLLVHHWLLVEPSAKPGIRSSLLVLDSASIWMLESQKGHTL